MIIEILNIYVLYLSVQLLTFENWTMQFYFLNILKIPESVYSTRMLASVLCSGEDCFG